jgi:ApaG protein
MMAYTEITHDIMVSVQTLFYDEKSDILHGEFCFVYFVVIKNTGTSPVRLMRRHWNIYDSNGENHVVDGEGVIGEQPTIDPGSSYAYNSFCILKSFKGYMDGYYTMTREDGSELDVIIPRFYLSARCN